MIALVEEELAGKVPLLLSNTSGLHKDWLFAKFPVFQHFAGGIYSHEAQCMKPHDAIFQQAVAAFDLDPATTFYIDDLEDNIATGQRLGCQPPLPSRPPCLAGGGTAALAASRRVTPPSRKWDLFVFRPLTVV